MQTIEIGKAKTLREGNRIAILLFGSLLETCATVAEKLGATLINMRFVKPMDETLLKDIAQTHDILVTVEDNAVKGGAGSGVNEFLLHEKTSASILNIGIPDVYLEHAEREQQLASIGLDADGLTESIQTFSQTITTTQDVSQKRALLAS